MTTNPTSTPRALDGIVIVAIEQAVAAPLATRQLADLGARVIKIERLDGGDFAREYDHMVLGTGAHFVWLNRGKESVALDLKSEKGRRILCELIGGADVFLQNLAPGAAARMGFNADTLRAADSTLVVVDMSGYGTIGPDHERKAYDLLVQAETGLISVSGSPETPVKVGIPAADIASGMYAFSGILSALLRRERTGIGASLEITMLDSVAEWMSHPMYYTRYAGSPPPRCALSHVIMAPYGNFPTADGVDLLIGVQNDRGWRELATEVLGRPDLADDPAFATNVARVENRRQIDAFIASVTSQLPIDQLCKRLTEVNVPFGRLNTPAELIEHPQLVSRDRWRAVGSPGGPIDAMLPPITFSDVEAKMGDVPALGQHTDSVLSEFGRSAAEIALLHDEGVIG
jgi:itaconate CoA-transferase